MIIIMDLKYLCRRAVVGVYDDIMELDKLLDRIDIPFNEQGIDPYGISRNHIKAFFPVVKWFYRNYFRVKSIGIENVPDEGRVMLVGNHSGSLPVDATMVVVSMVIDHDPPRFAIGMADKFAQRMAVVSTLLNRTGQITGLPGQAERLLNEERMLMVFPEGTRGIGKLYKDRYNLVHFTNGFMRLALKTNTPIIPFAFIGGEEAIPAVCHSKKLGSIFGAPYFPLTPYVLPLPLPVSCQIYYGEPMFVESDGSYEDIEDKVQIVKDKINELIAIGLENRGEQNHNTEEPK